MTILKDLLRQIEYKVIQGSMDAEVSSISYDSRLCKKDTLFVCVYGFITDGHEYIPQAVEKGATAILVQESVWETKAYDLGNSSQKSLTVVVVKDTRKALSLVSAAFFKNPTGRLNLLGITGTKGKTTSTYMVREILRASGKNVGLLGTNNNIVGGEISPSKNTTPESYDLQKMLSEMLEKGDDSCVMEVSSQGLMLDRVEGCTFSVAAFTNFYKDHIGEHEHASMAEYLNWKLHIFDMAKIAVINADCSVADEVISFAEKKVEKLYLYGLDTSYDISASKLEKKKKNGTIGTAFFLKSPWYEGEVFVGMPSEFNVYNALCAIAIAGINHIPFSCVKKALEEMKVPGRLQVVPYDGDFDVLVDYAHNAASLEQLLKSLREYTKGSLITVFGCGGNRAKDRRYEMGEVSGGLSDMTIITSDNPRKEEPMEIIKDILTGIEPTGGAFIVEEDRERAIEKAIQMAKKGDVVVIAGKGHENYQIFKDRTIHFDDAETAEKIIKNGTEGK